MSIKVIPAIIPRNLEDLKSKLLRVSGKVRTIQVDITDGVYSPKESWPYNNKFSDFSQFETQEVGLPFWEDFDYEFDLMISNPEVESEKYLKAGAATVIYHFESTSDLDACINLARNYGASVGLAFKPSTLVESISPFLEKVNFVQFMGNDEIGSHGVELDESLYEKISSFHKEFPTVEIGVDIGVNFDTAPKLVEAGVKRLVSGSTIFNAPDAHEAISQLKG